MGCCAGVCCAVMLPILVFAVLEYAVLGYAVLCHVWERGEYCIQCRSISESRRAARTDALLFSMCRSYRRPSAAATAAADVVSVGCVAGVRCAACSPASSLHLPWPACLCLCFAFAQWSHTKRNKEKRTNSYLVQLLSLMGPAQRKHAATFCKSAKVSPENFSLFWNSSRSLRMSLAMPSKQSSTSSSSWRQKACLTIVATPCLVMMVYSKFRSVMPSLHQNFVSNRS